VIIFAVGSTDRLFYRLHISYVGQIDFWRIGAWGIPIVVFFLTRNVCRALAAQRGASAARLAGQRGRPGR
jgi:hypothetical protein